MSTVELNPKMPMYLMDGDLRTAFHVSRTLGKPLLLEGEPGTGKTQLAMAYAAGQEAPLFTFPTTSASTVEQLRSSFDNVQRLFDAQYVVANTQMEKAGLTQKLDMQGRQVDHLDDYVRLGALALAYKTSGSVLLIDEIDKAPRDFPNSVLFELDQAKIIIPETRQVIAAVDGRMPTTVITSNREQALSDAFLRRCIYHFIEFPAPNRMREIVRLHYPGANEKLVRSAIDVFYQIRELKLDRSPATGEFLDWLAYLQQDGHVNPKDLDKVPAPQTLFKSVRDRELLQWIQDHGVKRVQQVRAEERRRAED